MKFIIHEARTDGYPEPQEVTQLCRPGSADTCIWLLVGPEGFECSYYNKHPSLVDRWEAGMTNAKRDGCGAVKEWLPLGQSEGEHQVVLLPQKGDVLET